MKDRWPPALGLTAQSSNKEKKEAVFQYVQELGTLMVSTIAVDGITPTTRAIEVHFLDDAHNLYITMSHGKPLYRELMKNPRISCGTIQFLSGKRGFGVRINAELEEVREAAYFDRYWKQNPGTRSLYRKHLDNYAIFRLAKGDGELFDLVEDDKILRYRFGFGGAAARPWHYTVNERCIGCGACADPCMTSVIRLIGGRAVIDHSGCLECGVCREVCPCGAIDASF